MSASFKPPRKRGPQPCFDTIARALVDAELLGNAYAARHAKVHLNTIKNWRNQWTTNPEVARRVVELKRQINEGWIETARAARLRLIERQIELAEKPDARLAAVTNAFRRTNEAILAHEVLSEPDAEPPGADQPEDPGEDQGPDGAEGGRKTPED